jgi:putative membrane-bound dehydrogenase-like protein
MLVLVVVGVVVRGQQSPDKSLAAIKMAPGLEVKLWASEPMMSNPTDLTVDERGRVWVLEGVNYRLKSRNLPDNRPAGDRILILEDTDHDGKADKVKVFDQNPQIRVPLGIAVVGDKVYISQSPDLIVYTKDADDKIIKREVLLTGFGGIDHDHGLHAVSFGPDGKFYFNQGNTGFDITDKSGKHLQMQATTPNAPAGYFQGAVFRMNGDGTNVEVIGQNFRNPYEVAVDSFGNVFQTDNDDDGNAWTRLVYNYEGGNYGYRGPLNKTWGDDRGSHWHTEVPGVVPVVLRLGAGSPCGLLVYEGLLLPPAYRGQLLHAEAGKRIVALYTLSNDGAGYAAKSQDVLNGGTDTWTRPTDVAVAPDGAVFVSDWYDSGVGGHLMWDTDGSRGRIYRIAPVGNKPQATPKVDVTSQAGLRAAFASPNQSTRYLAHMAIASQGQAAAPLLQSMWRQTGDPILKARALWLLGKLGEPGAAAIQEALKDKDPRFRILGLRVAQLDGADMLAIVKPVLNDPSPQVRREAALVLRDRNPALMTSPYLYKDQTQPSAEWLDAMSRLAMQYDGKDRWYLEAIDIAAQGREDALYARLKNLNESKSNAAFGQLLWGLRPKTAVPDLIATINNASAPMPERQIALDTLGAMQWPEAARALESFISAAGSPQPLVERAFGLYSHQLFSMWADSKTSPALPAVLRKGLASPGTQVAAVAMADAIDDPQYLPDLMTLAKSGSAAPDARVAAVDLIAVKRDPKFLTDLEGIAESGPTPLRVSALKAIGSLNQPSVETWAQKVVTSDSPNEVRIEALRVMGRSAPGLTLILDMAEKGTLPPELKSLATALTNYAAPPPAPGRRNAPLSPVAIRQGRGAAPTDPAYVAVRDRAAKVLPLPTTRVIPSAL